MGKPAEKDKMVTENPHAFVLFLHDILWFHMRSFMSMGDKCIQDSQFSFSLEWGKKERINSPLMGS